MGVGRGGLGFMLILMGRILIVIRRLRKTEGEREREGKGRKSCLTTTLFLFRFYWAGRVGKSITPLCFSFYGLRRRLGGAIWERDRGYMEERGNTRCSYCLP